jgi:RNA polymerase sigma-70 factor (ECF subfamily)
MIIPLFLAIIQDDEDRELLTEYYERHRFTLLYIAQGILHDHGLAEDAMQEAFVRLAKNIKHVRPDPKEVRSYLGEIVKNVAIDIRKKNSCLVSLDEIMYESADPENAEDLALLHVEADAIKDIVQTLPLIYSTVFLLRYKHDCSDRNIAALLEISEATVRKRLQRAKEKITEAVQ